MDGLKAICYQIVDNKHQTMFTDTFVAYLPPDARVAAIVETARRQGDLKNIPESQIRVWKLNCAVQPDVVDFQTIISEQAEFLRKSTKLFSHWHTELPKDDLHVVVAIGIELRFRLWWLNLSNQRYLETETSEHHGDMSRVK